MAADKIIRKAKVTMKVAAAERLAEGVYSLKLQKPEGEFLNAVRPGQFVGVYPKDGAMLLPRPISICDYDTDEGWLRLVYRVVGKGTGEFSGLHPGDSADVLGILGNGYDTAELSGKRILLLGGGIGAPPMLGLAKALYAANRARGMEHPEELETAVMGYRSNDLFLTEEFRAVSHLIIATDDGSAGFHGNVVEAVRSGLQEAGGCPYDAVCACGPLPMLKGVKALAQELQIPCWISLEERMACGVGACLGCVVKTTKEDGHSHVNNARICTEGPVFAAEEVEI
jgi:dihydroorotate dehydrogenase electron transfer subunit